MLVAGLAVSARAAVKGSDILAVPDRLRGH